MRRSFLHLLFVFLLVFAQQGAAVHALSHYADADTQQQSQDQAPHSPLCEQCLGHAQLIGTGASEFTFAVTPTTAIKVATSPTLQYRQGALNAYRARAPPSLA
ncbi:hypothetical protein [Methylobacillus flagellatus]|uniref:hypothetical protein n=1 Tax=Methylobacillus flagellatus TaxID=405 RepID=UPI0010F95A7D|nr:hypothetical protein [Methylobacillus flagellatus]